MKPHLRLLGCALLSILTTAKSGAQTGSSADTSGAYNKLVHAIRDGKIAVGEVSTPGDYLLYVGKGILTEKLRVANRSDRANWADFVFADDYCLPGIYEVERFIKQNRHLPDIPSTDEVTKQGIDVAEMDAKLLQKIEELTLYVIQLRKELDALKAE